MHNNETELTRITQQLRAAFYGPAWHGPALMEVLEGLTSVQACARPLPERHNIWELTSHVSQWHREAAATLRGKRYETLQGEDDWPALEEQSGQAWEQALKELERSLHDLLEATAEFPHARLEEAVEGKEFTYYVLLHGIAQHDLYHAGQIAILRQPGLHG